VKFFVTNSDWKSLSRKMSNITESTLFDMVDQEITIKSGAVLQNESIVCEVYDKNMISDRLIGKGSVRLLGAGLPVPGTEVELSIVLTDESNAITGEIVLYVTSSLTTMNTSEVVPIPADFQFGYFRILKITTHDLVNTEWLGKQVMVALIYIYILFINCIH
jgi:hypothetical protein